MHQQTSRRMTMPALGPGFGLAVLLVLVSADATRSCMICLAMPQVTVADRLIESQQVVLAREHPARPCTYSPIEVLKGAPVEQPIELFVNSATRRILSANDNYAVLLVRVSPGDSWQSLGIAREEYQRVIRRILAVGSRWQTEPDSWDRIRFFVPLFNHTDRSLRELAWLEIGRAPYPVIQKLARHVPREDLDPLLTDREYLQWRSLAILMLAQHPEPADRQLIENSFRRCHEFSLSLNLSAWATALIELNGQQAVQEIEARYLRNPRRSDEEVRQVLMALAVHAENCDFDLQQAIFRAFEMAIRNHPSAAAISSESLDHGNIDTTRTRLAERHETSRADIPD
jgi:hypothetical protein